VFDIEMHEMSPAFLQCWKAAGMHLNNQVQGGIQTWLRAHPHPPVLEHLSFRLGNQLYFVRIEDVDQELVGPGTLRGLCSIAESNRGHACVMPMKKKFIGGRWEADRSGWGLIDAISKRPIDPVLLVTDDRIEMTPWELQDMAVQVVRNDLAKSGYKVTSWQGNPEVDPAIWFVGDSGGPEWIVVRCVKYPERRAATPLNLETIARKCGILSQIGHFASVALVSADQPFKSEKELPIPLWRGYGMHIRYTGLE
jgi:hypothetical protein